MPPVLNESRQTKIKQGIKTLKDVQSTEGYYVHLSTKNKSFIKLFKQLKEEGITNNKFFLRLYDKSLMNVDPHDEDNLTPEQKARIWTEVRRNPWYYLREVCRIPVSGRNKQFELHKGNLAIAWCKLMSINFIAILPRQNYKTVTELCVDAWIYNYGTNNTHFVFSNKGAGDAQRNLQTLKGIIDTLPMFLRIKDKGDTDNATLIRTNINNNTIRLAPNPNDPEGADKAGRGMSTPQIFFDEFAFLKHNDIIYGSAYPAFSQASLEAKASNKSACISIITTPNNLNLAPAKFCKEMINNACKFTSDFYDMNYEEITNFIEANSGNDYVFVQYHWWEIGRDKAWYEKQKRGLNGNMLLVRRELDLEWTLASDVAPFTEDQLEDLRYCLKPVNGEIMINKLHKIIFHQDIDFKKSYMITVDTAGGLGRDFTALCFIDPITGHSVGHFKSSKITSPAALDLLVILLRDYFINSFVVIERNIYGLPLIQFLLKSPVASRVYYEERSEETKGEKTIKKMGSKRTKAPMKRIYGFTTDKNTRPRMVNEILYDIVIESPELITDRAIFDEITTLERKSDTRIEHTDGAHDDLLMAFLIGQHIIRHGRNLAKFITNVGFNEDKGLQDSRLRRRKNFSKLSAANLGSNATTVSALTQSMIDDGYALERPKSNSNRVKRFKSIIDLNS